MHWYLAVLKKYFDFDGRAHRTEYWMFVLVNFFVHLGLAVVDIMLFNAQSGYGPLSLIYSLAVLLPSLGVSVRRLHDTDRSGWWVLISIIPFVGILVFIVLMALPGQQGTNRFGDDPWGDSSASED